MHIMGRRFILKMTANCITLSSCPVGAGGGARGEVCEYSRGSKTRLLALLNSALFEYASFVTLTYRKNESDPEVAYSDLRKLHKRFCREFGGTWWVWRREAQKRGAMHFHTFVFDRKVDRPWMSENWASIAGTRCDLALRKYGTHVVDIGRLEQKDAGVLVSYLAKYAAKSGKVAGRAWGQLGGQYSQRAETKVDVSMMSATLLTDLILRAGGKKVTGYDCPVTSYQLYLGHMGSARDGNGVTAVQWVTNGTQLTLETLAKTYAI